MTEDSPTPRVPNQLERFLSAQAPVYEQALNELRQGRKKTHWMWFTFPQLAGLGRSATAKFYAIADLEEAKDYLRHPVLGRRLQETCDAILSAPAEKSATDILGFPDDLKLKSSATLFAAASGIGSVFDRILSRFFNGQPDDATLSLLEPRLDDSFGKNGT